MRLRAATIARLRYRWLLSDRPGDWIEAHIAEPRATRWVDRLGTVTDRIDNAVMPKLCAHDEATTECGIPDHDYCRGCGKPMPGMAVR